MRYRKKVLNLDIQTSFRSHLFQERIRIQTLSKYGSDWDFCLSIYICICHITGVLIKLYQLHLQRPRRRWTSLSGHRLLPSLPPRSSDRYIVHVRLAIYFLSIFFVCPSLFLFVNYFASMNMLSLLLIVNLFSPL